uniref:NADH dehydrogenase subunit 5 n=1 Tax=Parascaris univalens TaxID=6257 RepID=A0A914ZJ67_PARUN
IFLFLSKESMHFPHFIHPNLMLIAKTLCITCTIG